MKCNIHLHIYKRSIVLCHNHAPSKCSSEQNWLSLPWILFKEKMARFPGSSVSLWCPLVQHFHIMFLRIIRSLKTRARKDFKWPPAIGHHGYSGDSMQTKTMPSEPRGLWRFGWKKKQLNLLVDIYLLQSIMKAISNFCKILHSWKESIWKKQKGRNWKAYKLK